MRVNDLGYLRTVIQRDRQFGQAAERRKETSLKKREVKGNAAFPEKRATPPKEPRPHPGSSDLAGNCT